MIDLQFFNSADTLLHMNATLLRWLGARYFLTFFALGMAIWAMRYLMAHLFAPLGVKSDLKNKALIHLVMGGFLCALLVVPVDRFPHLGRGLDAYDTGQVTPAAAFGKEVLADGSDYFSMLFILSALGFTFEDAHEEETQRLFGERLAARFFEQRTKWFTTLITQDITGLDTEEGLAYEAGDVTEDATGNEGGLISGFRNLVSAGRGAYDMLSRMAAIGVALVSSPLTLLAYVLGLFVILVIGVWVNFLAYAVPLLFVAILFLLPISYCFDGTARLIPLVKLLVAFALSKPLAVLFITLGFALIDGYMLNLFQSSGVVNPSLQTVYTPEFFLILRDQGVSLQFSLPLVLGISCAAAVLALFAPVITYLVLGAEGGTLAGFISSAYIMAATQTARLAGMGANAVKAGG